ncbi:hypothetical protein [Psychrobacter celer]|uniref:hypothetical protein n=1 Tax=Psychrobacter celer TaxID=306572 RepID=UPI002FE462E1
MDTNKKVLDHNLSLLAMLDMAQAYIDNSDISDELASMEYLLKGMRTILDNATLELTK